MSADLRRRLGMRVDRSGARHRVGLVLDRSRAYANVVRDLAYLLSKTPRLSERIGLLKFLGRQYLWNLGIGTRRDVEIRFRDVSYVVAQSIELHALAEVYRDGTYSRCDEFLPASGSTVVDVGGNVGVFAVFHAAGGARVLSLEPNPDAFRRLSATVTTNGLEGRVTALNVALGAHSGHGRLTVPSGLSVLGAVAPVDAAASTASETVEIVTLDELLAAHDVPTVDLLKVDVEGAEVDVLHGAARALPRVRRVVLEYHSPSLLSECRALLAGSGFREVERFESAPGIGMLYVAR